MEEASHHRPITQRRPIANDGRTRLLFASAASYIHHFVCQSTNRMGGAVGGAQIEVRFRMQPIDRPDPSTRSLFHRSTVRQSEVNTDNNTDRSNNKNNNNNRNRSYNNNNPRRSYNNNNQRQTGPPRSGGRHGPSGNGSNVLKLQNPLKIQRQVEQEPAESAAELELGSRAASGDSRPPRRPVASTDASTAGKEPTGPIRGRFSEDGRYMSDAYKGSRERKGVGGCWTIAMIVLRLLILFWTVCLGLFIDISKPWFASDLCGYRHQLTLFARNRLDSGWPSPRLSSQQKGQGRTQMEAKETGARG